MKTIEVGDVLYNMDCTKRIEIERTTATQAIAKNGVRIKRTTEHKGYTTIGAYGNYYLPKEDSEQKYKDEHKRMRAHNEKLQLARTIHAVTFSSLTTDQLTRIINIVNEGK